MTYPEANDGTGPSEARQGPPGFIPVGTVPSHGSQHDGPDRFRRDDDLSTEADRTWDAEPPADVLARSAADIKLLSAQAETAPPITPERLAELLTAARGQLVGVGRLAMSQKERLIADLADALVAVTAPPRWVMAHTEGVEETISHVTAGQLIGFVPPFGTARDMADAERHDAITDLIHAAEGDDIRRLDEAVAHARRAFGMPVSS